MPGLKCSNERELIMAQDKKRLLIVDDTEIDRIILKSILCTEFEIDEADSGNTAFEYIMQRHNQLDAILLDISMPHIDGFDVLRFMKEKGVDNIPVFLVTADPTRDNVEKALQFKIAEFIGKPFDKDDILRRLRSRLGIIPTFNLDKEELAETLKYIDDLTAVYNNYLKNFGKNDQHYRTMVDLMKMLLVYYAKTVRGLRLTTENVDLISRAAYFCDIGEMFIPDKMSQIMAGYTDTQDIQHTHTILGANLIRLNRSKNCSYFVELCAGMCLHHHERFDGQGYPYHIMGYNNSIYNQMCRLCDEFDNMRSKFYGSNAKPVKFIIRRLTNNDPGMVSPELYALLSDSDQQIVDYFLRMDP